MSSWQLRPLRLAVSISGCASLVFTASLFASGAITGDADSNLTAAGAEALQPAVTAPTAEPEAGQPTADETAAEPDPDSSPAETSSTPSTNTPVGSEAPAEDPRAAPVPTAGNIQDQLPSTDPDSSVPSVEEPEPEERQPDEPEPAELQAEQPQPDEPQPADPAESDEQPPADSSTEPTDEQREGDRAPSHPDADNENAPPRSEQGPDSSAPEGAAPSDPDEGTAWQPEAVPSENELPGGGVFLFDPGDDSPGRRMVAAYGHPSTGGLGVLGEQGPEAAVERLRSMAEGYNADGSAVLLAFEIIATVASASAGADGDYSRVTDHELIRPWIETAAANDVYVVLDLQPGRTDFLSQAKLYEEFLRLPHVGLALDPEWRLKPDQVHLRQVGTVDAAEINQVVDWLAGIVREEALPQKLLIVHQFRFSMITNREQIETPPELAVLIHMDGQGSLGAKYNTWNSLTGLPDADRFWWGWKNFYDEDSPVATPDQVLDLSPNTAFVSFQ